MVFWSIMLACGPVASLQFPGNSILKPPPMVMQTPGFLLKVFRKNCLSMCTPWLYIWMGFDVSGR